MSDITAAVIVVMVLFVACMCWYSGYTYGRAHAPVQTKWLTVYDLKDLENRQQYTRLTTPFLVVCLHMANTKPWVIVAAFCEKLLVEQDGVPTAVRIVDTYSIGVDPHAPPDLIPGILVQGLISLRSGDVVGNRTIRVVMENPLGERQDLLEGGWKVVFTGGEQGTNIRLNFALGVRNFGLCWFDVLCDDELLTRIPLKLQQGEKPESTDGTMPSGQRIASTAFLQLS